MRDRKLQILVALTAWAIAIPFLADAVGLELGVDLQLEVVDHVLPGVVTLLGVGLLIAGRAVVAGAAMIFLAGLFITSAHLPLVVDALDGTAPVVPALLHLSTGPPIAWLGARLLVQRL